MKIKIEKAIFSPITITFETQEEVECLLRKTVSASGCNCFFCTLGRAIRKELDENTIVRLRDE